MEFLFCCFLKCYNLNKHNMIAFKHAPAICISVEWGVKWCPVSRLTFKPMQKTVSMAFEDK